MASLMNKRIPWAAVGLAAGVVGVLAAGGVALQRAAARPEVVIASFATSLRGRTPDQAHNIRVAAQRVDGVVLRPGAVFSFQQALGKVSAGDGFVKALAIRDGEPSEEDGGGVCQVASTIYNAALKGNLGIVERRKHLWPVHSVPPGLDATFAFGHVDMKFRNTLRQPVRVRVLAEPQRLVCRIVGERPEAAQVRVERAVLSALRPSQVLQASPLLRRGERRVAVKGRAGWEVEVWRHVTMNGEQRQERISRDRYAPLNQVVEIGTRGR